MDWADFFEKTRVAAGAKSFSELAPRVGVTDGAISHYRTGRRVPHAWTVAACLKIQGVPNPEKQAAKIMVEETNNAQERAFWRRFAAAAAVGAVAIALPLMGDSSAVLAAGLVAVPQSAGYALCIMRNRHRWRSYAPLTSHVHNIPPPRS